MTRQVVALSAETVRLFWSHVRKAEDNGCWLWTGKPGPGGYGRASLGVGRKTILAHRMSWLIEHGELPPDECVLHDCDNRPCIRPGHLFLGDRGANARDMASKGRQFLQQHPERALRGDRHPARARPERLARGERHGGTKVSDEQVLEIRARVAAGEFKKRLALEFGLCESTVGNIASGLFWKHLGGPITPVRRRKAS